MARGTDVLTNVAVNDNDTAICPPQFNPSITVTKFCQDAEFLGEPITFNGVVTNAGNEELVDVTVVDDNGTPGDTSDDQVVFGPITLGPGETASYSGSYIPAGGGPSEDKVTVTGSGVLSKVAVSDTDTATCIVPNQGCTPGFWQGGNGSQLWDETCTQQGIGNDCTSTTDANWAFHCGGGNDFFHDRLFNSFFAVPSPNKTDSFTMLEVAMNVVKSPIGKAARDVVACYLSADCNGGANGLPAFPFAGEPEKCAALWQDAVDGTISFQDVSTVLDGINNPDPLSSDDCPLGLADLSTTGP